MTEPVVTKLRNIAKFDDYVNAGKANNVLWMMHTLSALRQPGCRDVLKMPLDATDAELFQEFYGFPDKQRLLKKNGCPLHSAIQAETHLRQLALAMPKTAWEREAKEPTGKLDKLKWKGSLKAVLVESGLRYVAYLTFLLALALAGCAGWMQLNGVYVNLFSYHLWAWPHGFLGAAVLAVVAVFLGTTNSCLQRFNCCRRCCKSLARCCCCCCINSDDVWRCSGCCSWLKRKLCCCCIRKKKRVTMLMKVEAMEEKERKKTEKAERRAARRGSNASNASMNSTDSSNQSPKSSSTSGSPKRSSGWAATFSASSAGSSPMPIEDSYDGDSDLEDVPYVEPPDAYTLACCMVSPSKKFPDGYSNDPETTMVPWQPSTPASRGSKSVSFRPEEEESPYPSAAVPTTVSVRSSEARAQQEPCAFTELLMTVHAEGPPTHPIIEGSISALWHDPSYSFACRFARDAAKAAAEAARDPAFTGPINAGSSDVSKAKTVLQNMVVDTAEQTLHIEEELRPHMVQFYQDTTFQSEPKYPHWHPGSVKSIERKTDLHRCSKKNTKRMFKPLVPPPVSRTVTPLRGGDVYSPTHHSDAVSLTGSGSGFGLETSPSPHVEHMVGLLHPESFGPLDDGARTDAYGGERQQSLYGWTTSAGPKFNLAEAAPAKEAEDDQFSPQDPSSPISKMGALPPASPKKGWGLVKHEVMSPVSKTNITKAFSSPASKGKSPGTSIASPVSPDLSPPASPTLRKSASEFSVGNQPTQGKTETELSLWE